MAKVENGDWAAFTVNGGLRYTYQNKMVKKSDVPQALQDYFGNALAAELQPDPGFQERVAAETAQPEPATPELSSNDFDDEPTPQEVANAAAVAASMQVPPTAPQYPPTPQATPVATEVSQGFQPPAPQPTQIPVQQFPAPQPYQEPTPAPAFAAPAMPPQPAALQGMTIFDADITDLARALYERFGVYTIFLRRAPEADEVSPITGQAMTNYDRGLAYQAFVRAEANGTLHRDMSQEKANLDAVRMQSTQFHQNAPQAAPTYEQAVRTNSFDYRTSPESLMHNNGMQSRRNPEDESDPIAEPPMMNAPIVRPNW